MTLDEAIKHCLEVVEENDLAAGMYEILAENNHNAYERLTAETNSSRCTKCATDHKQLAEWLTELKDLREENKVLMLECDRLIKEKKELLSKVSGGDVLRICHLEEQLQVELDNSHCLEIESKEAKRLLGAALEDLKFESQCRNCKHRQTGLDTVCRGCRGNRYEWRYANEVLALLKTVEG